MLTQFKGLDVPILRDSDVSVTWDVMSVFPDSSEFPGIDKIRSQGLNIVLSRIGWLSCHHYVNVSVLIKFSQNTSVFTLIIISSP